jgi:hypothetical protein
MEGAMVAAARAAAAWEVGVLAAEARAAAKGVAKEVAKEVVWARAAAMVAAATEAASSSCMRPTLPCEYGCRRS